MRSVPFLFLMLGVQTAWAEGIRFNVVNPDNFKILAIEASETDAKDSLSPTTKNLGNRICGQSSLVPDFESIQFKIITQDDGSKVRYLSNLDCIEAASQDEVCTQNSLFDTLKNFVSSTFSIATLARKLGIGLFPAKSTCQADEVDPQSKGFLPPTSDPNFGILSEIQWKYPGCLKKEKVDEYLKFHDALAAQGREVNPYDIVKFLDIINEEKSSVGFRSTENVENRKEEV